MKWLIKITHTNIPFCMLYDSHLQLFLKEGINPEIGLDAPALDRFSLSDFRSVADKLREAGLRTTLHGPWMDLSPGSSDPVVRAFTQWRFEQMLELVPVFRPKTVVCHAGYDKKRYGFLWEAWLENSIKSWTRVAQRIKDEESTLMLENVYEHEPSEIGPLLENLRDQGVGFCLDTGHHRVFSHAPLETWVEALKGFLGQIHLHDNKGLSDEHLALGKGDIDFQGLLMLIKEERRAPPLITLEPHREEDFRPSLVYLGRIWPW